MSVFIERASLLLIPVILVNWWCIVTRQGSPAKVPPTASSVLHANTPGRQDRGCFVVSVVCDYLLGVPAGEVAGCDALACAVIGIALDGGLVVFLPQDGVVPIDEEQFADDEEEHLGVLEALRCVP